MRSSLFLVLLACNGSDPAKKDASAPPPGPRAAVGRGGMYTESVDGKPWMARQIRMSDLNALTFANAKEGWAVGPQGFITHTSDGGAFWYLQDSKTTADLYAVRFLNPMVGVACGDKGTVVETQDGGMTWTASTKTLVPLRAAASSTDAIFVAGDSGTMMIFEKGAWKDHPVVGASDILGMSTDPMTRLVFVSDRAGQIFASKDRGGTFTKETTLPDTIFAISVDDNATRAVAAGSRGTVAVRNAGMWTRVESKTTIEFHAALAASDGDYVAGDKGTLLVRSDREFNAVMSGTTADLLGLDDH